jgi:hypothetical protein
LDFYTRFTVVHPHAHVGVIAFKKLKPYFVWKLKDFNSCCCRYHQEMVEIKLGFNNMRVAHVHLDSTNEPCMCGHDNVCSNPPNSVVVESLTCQAHHHVYKRNSSLWELYLCPKLSNVLFFKLECVQGRCQFCGFHCLPLCEKRIATYHEQCCRMVEVWESLCLERLEMGNRKKSQGWKQRWQAPKCFLHMLHLNLLNLWCTTKWQSGKM